MYLSQWIRMESRRAPCPLMQSRQSQENTSGAIPVSRQKEETKTSTSSQNLRPKATNKWPEQTRHKWNWLHSISSNGQNQKPKTASEKEQVCTISPYSQKYTAQGFPAPSNSSGWFSHSWAIQLLFKLTHTFYSNEFHSCTVSCMMNALLRKQLPFLLPAVIIQRAEGCIPEGWRFPRGHEMWLTLQKSEVFKDTARPLLSDHT